ncbi:hypothetical protein COOONC_25852 [Cooperia oncophora]
MIPIESAIHHILDGFRYDRTSERAFFKSSHGRTVIAMDSKCSEHIGNFECYEQTSGSNQVEDDFLVVSKRWYFNELRFHRYSYQSILLLLFLFIMTLIWR